MGHSARWLGARVPLFTGACLLLACSEESPPEGDYLVIAAVQVTPPAGAPGAGLTAEMLLVDSASRTETEIAWLGGCHNPPSSDHSACLPRLASWVGELESPMSETPESWRAAHRNEFGLGAVFTFELPETVVREPTGDGPAYGVSYLFFAACEGNLRPAPESTSTVPVTCHDGNGKRLGPEYFAVGFATIFSFSDSSYLHRNPSLTSVRLDGSPIAEQSCSGPDDCATLSVGTAHYGCAEGRCLPTLRACTDGDCPTHEVEPRIDEDSYEANPLMPELPREILSIRLHTTLTVILGEDQEEPVVENLAAGDRARFQVRGSRDLAGVMPLQFVVSDNRGGFGWWETAVLVE